MNKSNKIVRVRKIFRTNEDKSHQYYEDYLTFFKDAMIDTYYKGYGSETKLLHYKWYEIQWLWTHPTFLLLHWIDFRFKITLSKNKMIKLIMNSITFIFESILAWFIVEKFKYFLIFLQI